MKPSTMSTAAFDIGMERTQRVVRGRQDDEPRLGTIRFGLRLFDLLLVCLCAFWSNVIYTAHVHTNGYDAATQTQVLFVISACQHARKALNALL